MKTGHRSDLLWNWTMVVDTVRLPSLIMVCAFAVAYGCTSPPPAHDRGLDVIAFARDADAAISGATALFLEHRGKWPQSTEELMEFCAQTPDPRCEMPWDDYEELTFTREGPRALRIVYFITIPGFEKGACEVHPIRLKRRVVLSLPPERLDKGSPAGRGNTELQPPVPAAP